MKILTSEQIRKVDAETIDREGISSLDLMNRAASAFCNWFTNKYHSNHLSIAIFSGVGNNGGDGLVIARILNELGYNVNIFIVEYSNNYSDDCAHNALRIKADSIHCKKILNQNDIPNIDQIDIVIDSIFGTGLSREIVGIAADVIDLINKFNHFDIGESDFKIRNSNKSVISVDVPSGLYLDRKTCFAVEASETVTFQMPKLALCLPENSSFVGNLSIVNIGLNEESISEIDTNIFFTTKEDIKSLLKPLSKYAHKGTEGHAIIIGGSIGKIGAVCLASRAALKTGCGLVTAYVPKCGTLVIQSQFAEAMVIEDKSTEYISEINFDISHDAIGIGVGMGQDEETIAAFYRFLKWYNGLLVIDADGLNILSKHPKWLSLLPPKTILTPHPKELLRLIGEWSNDYDKIQKTVQLAKKFNLVIIIKGAHSLIIDKDYIYVNSTGTPALATAGSGDVLTGMITSLLAQGYSSINAARVGVFLHGMTADISCDKIHPRSFIASDIIDNINNCYLNIESYEKDVLTSTF